MLKRGFPRGEDRCAFTTGERSEKEQENMKKEEEGRRRLALASFARQGIHGALTRLGRQEHPLSSGQGLNFRGYAYQ